VLFLKESVMTQDNVLTVLSLSGGNDGLNTVIPYTNGLYRDYRPRLGIPEDQIIPITDTLGFHPAMAPLKKYWDEGQIAIFLGIGYPNPSFSHFRSMDVWHTCEPVKVGTEGWLGRVIKELDPNADNVLTGVNLGHALPRAMAKDGVPVASVGNLETYGLLTGMDGQDQRTKVLDVFARMYSPTVGRGYETDYIRRTGADALMGAEELATAPSKYSSTVVYSNTMVGQYMKNIAQIHLAGFGTRILYTTSPYNVFSQAPVETNHTKMWIDISHNIDAFMKDLREHNASDNMLLFVFSEFSRHITENGSGTGRGGAGVAFAIGEQVLGGIYGDHPSLEPSKREDSGLLRFNIDFRSVYTTIVEDWFGLDPKLIVGGSFEKVEFL
jgi:uncharacterized protein (DUF1501 family)